MIVNRIAAGVSASLLVLCVMSATGAAALAQAPSANTPDLNGVWGWGRCVEGPGFECLLLEADDPRLTERARGFQAAFDEIAAPKYDCAPMSIPHMWSDPYEYQIEQLSDRVIITYEKDDVVRTVWLEGFDHPTPAINEFFVHGFSVGRYEGDALVVESNRFVFDPTGLNSDFKIPSSTQKHITERYWRDGETLALSVTTEDTFFLAEPWEFEVRSQSVDGELSLPWNCDLEAARQTLRLVPTDYPDDPAIDRIAQ